MAQHNNMIPEIGQIIRRSDGQIGIATKITIVNKVSKYKVILEDTKGNELDCTVIPMYYTNSLTATMFFWKTMKL